MNQRTATSLGKLKVSGIGKYEGSIRLPKDLTKGNYTLQANGLMNVIQDGASVTQVISASIRAIVRTTAAKTKTVQTIVHFRGGSTKLTKPAKRQLDSLIDRLPSNSKNVINFVGFVPPVGASSKTISLSKTRTKSVARYLESHGARGKYILKQEGTASQVLYGYILIKATGPVKKLVTAPVVKPQAEPTNKRNAKKATVQFTAYSANLTAAAKRQLATVVKRLPSKTNKTSNFIRIVGFVSAGGSARHVNTLSNARTKSVARYLKSKGVSGTYILESGGNASSSAKSAQRAEVTIYPDQ